MPGSGDIIGGKYALAEAVGEGAMGSVWRAVHQGLGRPFAVKFLKPPVGPDAAVIQQRFVREARHVASVQHRYVVAVVDAGVTREGVPYLVMEHLVGETLAQRLARGPALAARALCEIVAQALEGLEAVHAAGIVHRDLKPDNVVLAEDGGGVVPKLVDFGVSCSLRDAGRLTAPGTAVGTPWYMAPEQVRGAQDRRSDLYSVGVILYEALTGRPPYQNPDLLRLLEDVVAGAAPPALSVRPAIGADASAFVARAMAARPEDRFASAAAMEEALRHLAARLPDGLLCPFAGGEPPPAEATVVLTRKASSLVRSALAWSAFASLAAGLAAVTARGPRTASRAGVTTQIPPRAPALVVTSLPPPAPPAAEEEPVRPVKKAAGRAPPRRRARPPESFRDPGY